MEIRGTSVSSMGKIKSLSATESDQVKYMEMTQKHLNEIMSSAFTQRPIHETFMLELKRVSEGYDNQQEENEVVLSTDLVKDLMEIEKLRNHE